MLQASTLAYSLFFLYQQGSESSALLHLGGSYYFTWSRFNGTILANIRKYFVNKKGDIMPTKTGICINRKGYDTMKELVHSMVLIKDGAALDRVAKGVKVLDSAELIPALAKAVYENIADARYVYCNSCQGSPGTHICIANKTIKLTGQELDDGIELAKKKKTLESILFASNSIVVNQFASMPLAQFWVDNVGAIRAHVQKMFDDGFSN